MRTITTLLAAPLILILGISTPARAQDRHAVSPSALAAAVADHAATLDADRDAIREALNRPEVRAVAERTGIDIDRAAASIDTLDSSTLARAAESARLVNDALVGGASTITISTTTIIIVLLLIILIIVAAD
jgi:biotin carboxylase